MVCREFYEAYHSLIPKAEGFEARQEVYKLFFHLYHLYVPLCLSTFRYHSC
jgi:fructosamine-3-kinase